jgi:phosphoribosylamine--glycine ligase
MRLKSDLFELLMQATEGRLRSGRAGMGPARCRRRRDGGARLSAAPRKGDVIDGLSAVDRASDELQFFHAGTTLEDGELRTSGGRVLCVVALADSVRLAQAKALAAVRSVRFEGAQWRNDIGHRAIKPRDV